MIGVARSAASFEIPTVTSWREASQSLPNGGIIRGSPSASHWSSTGTAYAHWIAVYRLANSRVSRSARSARRPAAVRETGYPPQSGSGASVPLGAGYVVSRHALVSDPAAEWFARRLMSYMSAWA